MPLGDHLIHNALVLQDELEEEVPLQGDTPRATSGQVCTGLLCPVFSLVAGN